MIFSLLNLLYIKFRSWGFDLTNETLGGDGIPKGYIFSKETRSRMSLSHKGKKFTDEHRRKISESNKGNANFAGRKHSAETKSKIKQNNIGKGIGRAAWNKGKVGVYSELSLQKMRDAMKGRVAWNKGISKKSSA